MSTGAGHRVYRPGVSLVHQTPAHVKIVATLAFVVVVVTTPAEAYAAFGAYALLLAAALTVAGIPLAAAARHLVIEVPFVLFALALPFVAGGEQVQVWALSLSVPGLHGAWNLLVKATLGVLASLVLAATTTPLSLVQGLQRLRMPQLLVSIIAFMIRYADIVTAELSRMRIARESRAFVGRGPRSWPVLARCAGALFIRCYERGERVHLSMLSRGYAGRLLIGGDRAATRRDVAVAAALPSCALVVACAAWMLV